MRRKEYGEFMIALSTISICIVIVVMGGFTLYINHSWCKFCNEMNDRWLERCNEINNAWSELYKKAVNKEEEKK